MVLKLEELIDKYAWANDIEAWTVAAVEGRSASDVIRTYGGDPDNPIGDCHFAQLFDLLGPGEPEPLRFHMQVLTHGEFVVAIEDSGYSGNVPEIARRCSVDGGRFFSIHWNIHAAGTLIQAIDGK